MVKIRISQGLRVAFPLKPLVPVLKQWQKLMTDHPGWVGWETSDAPWWYGERASVSCLAGAIWKCQGWAFEEFKTRRMIAIKSGHEDRAGRCDFMFGLGKHQFIAEAKQSFCNIGEDAQRNASEVVGQNLQKARRESGQVLRWLKGYRRVGIVFAVPYLNADKQNRAPKSLIAEFLEHLLKLEHLTVAWAFPEHSRNLALRQEPQYVYPGAVVLIRPLKLKNRENE